MYLSSGSYGSQSVYCAFLLRQSWAALRGFFLGEGLFELELSFLVSALLLAHYPELLWNPGTISTFEVACILAVDLMDLNRFIVLFCCARAGQHLGASSWGRGSLSLNYLFSFRRFYLCITLNCYGTQGRSALLRLHVS